jgi:hypothetical protein
MVDFLIRSAVIMSEAKHLDLFLVGSMLINQTFFASLRMTRRGYICAYTRKPASLLPLFRQLLFKRFDWLEQVALFFDARQRLIRPKF